MTNPATTALNLADSASKDLATVEAIAEKAIADMKEVLDKYKELDSRIVIEPVVEARAILGSLDREMSMLQNRRNMAVATMPLAPQNL